MIFGTNASSTRLARAWKMACTFAMMRKCAKALEVECTTPMPSCMLLHLAYPFASLWMDVKCQCKLTYHKYKHRRNRNLKCQEKI